MFGSDFLRIEKWWQTSIGRLRGHNRLNVAASHSNSPMRLYRVTDGPV
jgi:hypothetical protein